MNVKKSRYAVHAEGSSGEHLVMNMATGAFAALNDAAWTCLEAASRDGEAQQDETQQLLLDAGFLVPADVDEVALQQAIFQASREDTDRLALALAPTYACNCRCVYCYEQDKAAAKSLMTPEVRDAVYALVEARYAEKPFNSLFIEWYGGEPTLCLDVVEQMSARFMDWCAERGVEYDSMMLSNCVNIGKNEAQRIAACGVTGLLATIDGPREIHNLRRPAIGVSDPFAQVKAAIENLLAAGIRVDAQINLDKVTASLLPDLQKEFADDLGVFIQPVKLNDYAHTYGTGCFAAPDFDLFTHEEFAQARFRLMAQSGMDAASLSTQLAPFSNFCLGQKENYLVIDAFGDAYKCDGWMGDKRRRLFNVLDDKPVFEPVTFDPFQDKKCAACELLPVCMGNCSWERELTGWPCHPLKYTLDDYLRYYRDCFGQGAGESVAESAGAAGGPRAEGAGVAGSVASPLVTVFVPGRARR